jgi:hypothetical protein
VFEYSGDFDPFAVLAPPSLDDGGGPILTVRPEGPIPDFVLSRQTIQSALYLGVLLHIPLPSEVPVFDPPLVIPPPIVPSTPIRSMATTTTSATPVPSPAQKASPKPTPTTPSPLSSKTAGKKPAPRPVSSRMATRASSTKKPTEFKVPDREFSFTVLVSLILEGLILLKPRLNLHPLLSLALLPARHSGSVLLPFPLRLLLQNVFARQLQRLRNLRLRKRSILPLVTVRPQARSTTLLSGGDFFLAKRASPAAFTAYTNVCGLEEPRTSRNTRFGRVGSVAVRRGNALAGNRKARIDRPKATSFLRVVSLYLLSCFLPLLKLVFRKADLY